MRLTLRTLLGYLDDILEPQQIKALGEKISESSYAAALVARIREVVRRRRILAPEVSGPGSDPDPNVVAEYLDNTLSPEKVEDFERLCLDSDIHLAEAAGSHQILTMVLGEPVEISSATRERMYALGTVAAPSSAARPQSAASLPPPTTVTPPAPTPASREVPEYLTRGTQWRRWLPGAAAVLIIGLWLALIFSDPTQSWRIWEQRPTTSAPVDTVPAADAPIAAVVADDHAATVAATDASTPALVPPVAATTPAVVESGTESTTAAVAGAPPALDTPAVAAMPAAPVSSPAADPTPVNPTAPTVALPGPIADSKLLYNAASGVLLQRGEMEDWLVLPRRTLLHPGDELATPEPFESPIQILDSDLEIVLAGGARAAILPISTDGSIALSIDRGRFLFRRSDTAPLPDVRPITLQFDDFAYTLELLAPGTVCGLDLVRQPSDGGPERMSDPGFSGELYLTAGSARLTPAAGAALTLDTTSAFLAFARGRPASDLQPLFDPPEWMIAPIGGTAVVAQQTARQFEEAFQLEQPVDATIPALVDDRHPRIAEFAAKTLALTDDYRGMIRALMSPHQEARIAGLIGLGIWIRRDPTHPQLLTDELARSIPEAETARRLMRLVWGYSPADGRRPDVSEELVTWLSDGNVGVREGAFFQIRRLTGGTVTYRYHPDGSETQRAAAVRQWEQHLRKTGALVEPGPTPTDTPPAVEPVPVKGEPAAK